MILFVMLPVLSFFLLWILFLEKIPTTGDEDFHWQETLIKTGLSWSVFLALGTELLNLVNGLTTVGIIFLWGSAILLLVVIHWRKKTFSTGWRKFIGFFANLKFEYFDYIALSVIFITLLILLITGLKSPPNVHDELTYHMSRIMHWVQNGSVAYFPTSITWQLWMPPFSEFSQLHWQLLAGGDGLSSLHQWYSLVLAMMAVGAIAKRFGAARNGQWLSALFVLSLPIVVLQASGAKNDIVLAFMCAALTYYVVKSATFGIGLMDLIFSSIAVGLGVLTKGNFPFFALPLLIWLLISILRRAGWKKALAFAGIGLLVVSMILSGHWIRNTLTFDSPLNTGDASFTINARFGVDVVISNLLRNIVTQLNQFGLITEALVGVIARIHTWLGIPLYDPSITQGPREYYVNPIREEVAGNPFHFLLTGLVIFLILITLIKNKFQSELWPPFSLALSAITGIIIFSGVFRWQVWGSRYFIPYYILFAPVVGALVVKRSPTWVSWLLGISLFAVMLNPLLNNYSRSFSWSENNRNSIWRMSRRGLRFANHRIYEGAVLQMTHLMDISGCRTYGMSIGANSPEYLIWGTLTPDSRDYYLEHTGVDNPSAVHATENFDPCGIIVFEAAPPETALTGDYRLYKGWPLEGYEGLPLTLYLKPDIISQNLE